MTRMGLEVASAYRYIEEQDDFGPMTREVLKGIVRKVAEAAISDVEDFAARTESGTETRRQSNG